MQFCFSGFAFTQHKVKLSVSASKLELYICFSMTEIIIHQVKTKQSQYF